MDTVRNKAQRYFDLMNRAVAARSTLEEHIATFGALVALINEGEGRCACVAKPYVCPDCGVETAVAS